MTVPFLCLQNRTVPFLCLQNRTVPFLCLQNRTVPFLCLQNRTVPFLCLQNRTVPFLCLQDRTVPFLCLQNRTVPFLCLQDRTVPFLCLQNRTAPFLLHSPGKVVLDGELVSTKRDRLVGLVVRRPPRELKIPGSNRACAANLSESSHTSGLKIDTPVAILSGVWRCRVCIRSGRAGVSIL